MQPGSIPLRTVGVEHLAPIHHVALAAVLLDQLVDVIAVLAVALGAFDAEPISKKEEPRGLAGPGAL
jgi:hypothetical protein